MRSREDIEADLGTDTGRMEAVWVLLEVLLDVRDLLLEQKQGPVVTHPVSPPPPEVKS